MAVTRHKSLSAFYAGVNGANITDGEELISPNGTFTLGFFSPGASTNRYLGVWFSVSNDTVCWVANRDRPLNSTSGALVLDAAGRLLLVDGASGHTVWSSNSSTGAPAVTQLLDSGNLVVLDRSNGMVIWQSFEHPSDTLLPGMKMGWSNWTRAELHLTPWRSADDPSPGTYRHVTELNGGLPENALWRGGAKVYRTGPWNGLRFSGITEASTYTNVVRFHVTVSPWEVTFGYTVIPGAPLTRVVVTEDGFIKRLMWDAAEGTWVTYFQGPRDVCDHYAQCGPFGLCDAGAASTSFCNCIRGFSPVSSQEWFAKETSGGCRRNMALDCDDRNTNGSTTDGFVVLQGIKLPDTHNASVDTSIDVTLEQCSMMCRTNCSCVAFAPSDIQQGRGCIMWMDKLVDLRYVDGGQDLYLRLAQSELGGHKHRNINKKAAIIAGATIGSAIILVILAVLIWKVAIARRIIRRPRRSPTVQDLEASSSSIATAVLSVDLSMLQKATKNFSAKALIGQGAYGDVYEAKLPRGHPLLRGLRHRTVAIKRLKSAHNQTTEDRQNENLLNEVQRCFEREVDLMSRLRRHENVARLLGLCNENDERILLYEYVHRRSLDTYIFGTPKMRSQLTWVMRVEIIRGIAKGVTHLHEGSTNNIIHRDLKPSNVLLDEKWMAKVGDFGTARFVPDETGTLTRIGTPGYMAPEYIRNEDDMTLKCDVYSFGVTLLETISGRRNPSATRFLLHTARRLWDERHIMGLLDSTVAPPPSSDLQLVSEVRRCIQIGLLCVHDAPEDRPTMPGVVEMLTSPSLRIPEPNIPVVSMPTSEVGETSTPDPEVHDEATPSGVTAREE